MKKLFLTFLLLLSGLCAFSQVNESISTEAPAMAFATIARDPVLAGKAYSGLASVDAAAWAAGSNPAATVFAAKKINVAASYLRWKASEGSAIGAGASLNMDGRMAFSLSFSRMGGKAYTEYDGLGKVMDEFTPSDMQLSLGAAYAFGNISAGAAVHYLRSSASTDNSQSAICADITGLAHFDSFNLAAGIKNLGGKVKDSSGGEFALPGHFFAAGEYCYALSPSALVKADADLSYFFKGGFSAAAGLEFSFRDMLFARGGYHLGNDVLPSFAAMGAGVKFAGIALDFAYLLSSSPVGGSIQAGLSAAF